MNPIIPAIIPTSAAALCSISETLTFTPMVHVDIVDGVFAEPASWPYEPAGEPSEACDVCERYQVQVDIMGLNPYDMAQLWIDEGAAEIIIHRDAVADLEPFKAFRNTHGIKLWVAAKDDTQPQDILPIMENVDGLQLMGISTIGKQGQALSPHIIETITAVRAAAPELPIQVDGSVNADTITALRDAGATQFVVGSAIMGAEHPREAYQQLRTCIS